MTEFKPIIAYRLEITLCSPLSIGSGENEFTDSDVIVDSLGHPFIPASAIAGVLRSALPDDAASDYQASRLFGYRRNHRNDTRKEYDSSLRIYDGRMLSETDDFYIATRDCVKLKNKVPVKGKKFDRQAVEPGVVFESFIELMDENAAPMLEKLLALLNSGALHLGSKTTRGYGKVTLTVQKITLNDVRTYIFFDMFQKNRWKDAETLSLSSVSSDAIELTLNLKCLGGLSIREYSTDIGRPDYKTMSYHGKINHDVPVLPGTSWAGAFRERFEEFAGLEATRELFGYVSDVKGNEEETVKSKITFSESRLKNGVYKESTRNSIDRFSAATKETALYMERTYYGGEAELAIVFAQKPQRDIQLAFCCVLADLHFGYLSVGGLTSVGRGIFSITAVNGKTDALAYLTPENVQMEELRKAVFGND